VDRRRHRLAQLRATTVDPLVPVVGVVALVVYALHGTDGMLTRDLAVYSYAGQQVAEGVPPYLGVLNRAGPLAHAIPAIGVGIARVGGWDDVTVMRLLFMVTAAVCVSMVYVLARNVFWSRPAGAVAAAAFLSFAGFIQYASNGPREKTPMTLFVVCALWAVTGRRWFTAGIFVSLATLCLQPAFFASFTAAVVGALLLASGRRVRALARIALGGLVPVGLCLLWFALEGAVQEALDAFLLINARYTTPDPLTDDVERAWEGLEVAYGASLWVLVIGLAALPLLSTALVRARNRRTRSSAPLMLAFALAAAASLAWNMHEYDAWPDLFPVLPLAAVGVAGLFREVALRAPGVLAVAVATALVASGTAIALSYSLGHHDDRLLSQRRVVEAVLAELPRDVTIASVEAPQPLVLARKRNPTRHQMFRSGLNVYIGDTWPGGMEGFRTWLVNRDSTLIALGIPVSQTWHAVVEDRYVLVASAPDFELYGHRSLGRAKLDALRAAAAG
jgi:hypothetical protein